MMKQKKQAGENLDKIKESVSYPNVSIKIIHNSSTINGVLSFIDKNDIDLVVMGSHGRSGFKKLMLGSVASAIITKAPCPVLTVKSSKSHNIA